MQVRQARQVQACGHRKVNDRHLLGEDFSALLFRWSQDFGCRGCDILGKGEGRQQQRTPEEKASPAVLAHGQLPHTKSKEPSESQ